METLETLRMEIDNLQTRLREETRLRMELERRCHLLEKLAYRDPDTGLRSESYLHVRVGEEMDRATRFPASTSLVTLCPSKERASRIFEFALQLSEGIRATDYVFRLSEHGLALLLVETTGQGARKMLERLSQVLERHIQGYGYTVTTFPADATVGEDFMALALKRHWTMVGQVYQEELFNWAPYDPSAS